MLTLEQAYRWYPDGDPVHNFAHVERVYHLADQLAIAEGADLEIVRAAALLHDAQAPSDNDTPQRKDHHQTAAAFACRLLTEQGWSIERINAVEHAILSHRYRDEQSEPLTLEAQVLFDADKLDAIGAVGVARAIAYCVMAGEPFYVTPSAHFIQTGETLPTEAHSAYHEYTFKLRKIKPLLYTETGHKLAGKRHELMTAYFEQLQAEMEGAL